MECKKYEIIEDGGRKRIRSLRDFTVQDRHVCIGDLGGYVYDDKTLGQNCPAWIFSGSLEYPGIHVYDEAIVDMGSNEPFDATARMKRVLIHGKSRIMGMMQFVSGSTAEVAQTPAMYEQGYYEGYAGVPFEAAAREATDKVRSKTMVWSAGAGKVVMPNENYEIMCNKLDEDGITLATTAWRKGGVDVSIDMSDAAAFVLNVRKVGGGVITPADIKEAGFSIKGSVQSSMDINNVVLSASYDRTATPGTALKVMNLNGERAILDNSSIRISYSATNAAVFLANCELYRTNVIAKPNPGQHAALAGIFRDTELVTIESTFNGLYSTSNYRKRLDVSDCKNLVLSNKTIPNFIDLNSKNGKLVFKGCNVPAGIFYYDRNPGGNVYTDIDFSKAMADLGKRIGTDAYVVSSNVQGMYRLRSVSDKAWGAMIQSFSSISGATISTLSDTYDSVIYKDCVIKGVFTIKGRNVFGGTLGGASKITNTAETAMVIDGSFRIEGNAQVTDTPLKGTGYIGDNAELKNGNVEGYVYMADNAKFIPETVANKPSIRRLVMLDNAQITKQANAAGATINIEMGDNAVIGAVVVAQFLAMAGNAEITRDDDVASLTADGAIFVKDNAKITGTGQVISHGHVELVGGFNLNAGSITIYGKHVIASPDDVNRPELPPTKETW